MTEEQQRIAIAEACGWQFIPEYYHGKDDPPEFTTVTPDGRHLCGYYPDYLNDLNAMHEAEKLLTEDQISNYGSFLKGKDNETVSLYAPEHREIAKVAMATAAQRAEAFLKTIGKWEKTK
jgi:hypothetical protein